MNNRQFWVLITVLVVGFVFQSIPDWVAMRNSAEPEQRQPVQEIVETADGNFVLELNPK
jgi:hypothetical protein